MKWNKFKYSWIPYIFSDIWVSSFLREFSSCWLKCVRWRTRQLEQGHCAWPVRGEEMEEKRWEEVSSRSAKKNEWTKETTAREEKLGGKSRAERRGQEQRTINSTNSWLFLAALSLMLEFLVEICRSFEWPSLGREVISLFPIFVSKIHFLFIFLEKWGYENLCFFRI